jgi:hypothetical protein
MSDTMIERMASEIASGTGISWLSIGDDSKSRYRKVARAVLTAMREPTEEMKLAGVKAPNYLEDQSSRRGCGNIYTAMIDAALAEEG